MQTITLKLSKIYIDIKFKFCKNVILNVVLTLNAPIEFF